MSDLSLVKFTLHYIPQCKAANEWLEENNKCVQRETGLEGFRWGRKGGRIGCWLASRKEAEVYRKRSVILAPVAKTSGKIGPAWQCCESHKSPQEHSSSSPWPRGDPGVAHILKHQAHTHTHTRWNTFRWKHAHTHAKIQTRSIRPCGSLGVTFLPQPHSSSNHRTALLPYPTEINSVWQ